MISDRSFKEFVAAELALERLWAEMLDELNAYKAAQLAMRVKIGEYLLSDAAPEKRVAIEKQIGTLRQALARARADPADVRRCAAWRDAFARWDAAYFQVQLEIQEEPCEQPSSAPPTPLFCQTQILI